MNIFQLLDVVLLRLLTEHLEAYDVAVGADAGPTLK